MAELNPWQPNALPFVAQLLRHLDAGSLPSEDLCGEKMVANRPPGPSLLPPEQSDAGRPRMLRRAGLVAGSGLGAGIVFTVTRSMVESSQAAAGPLTSSWQTSRKSENR